MDKVLIVFLSSTSAAGVKTMLERKYAVPSRILQTPSGISTGGCSYCLEVSDSDLNTAWNIVKSLGVSSKGVYRKGSLEKII